MNETETAIVAIEPVRPLVSADQAAADWARFVELKKKLLTDDDIAMCTDKTTGKVNPCIRKSGFRKLALAFGLSDRILQEVRMDGAEGSYTWRITVEVSHPNGRICAGVGMCNSGERKFWHGESDVYMMAHTRAKSRAISDMVAGGVPSAEEVESEPQSGTAPAKPQAASKSTKKSTFGNEALFPKESKKGDISE